jgi:hypothetical protein
MSVNHAILSSVFFMASGTLACLPRGRIEIAHRRPVAGSR